jgi:hypothetical protein
VNAFIGGMPGWLVDPGELAHHPADFQVIQRTGE